MIGYTKNIFEKQMVIIISVCLILVTTAIYWQVQGFDFVNYDDGDYVTDNPNVQKGFTVQSIIWAMTTGNVSSNWHPLTLFSHMLDWQMYGEWAGGHHLTGLFFHITNALLLFFIFKTMTGNIWQSAFVAAIFAIHPLHVQSVAWVSERKDVLSAFFWMLTLWAYVRYVRHHGWAAYVWVLVFFILGLMSKPMVVTLPFVLLLLDYWPLNRIQLADSASNLKVKIISLFQEKIPLFTLSAASAAITFYVQQEGGSVKSLDVAPLAYRLPNILISYINYIIKTVYPVKLAAFYPYPNKFPWWQIAAAGVTLTAITWLTIRLMRRSPYVLVGWLWFLGTLVPVIGLVQVGIQSMADRYMYLPMIGLLVVIAWGVPELISNWRYNRLLIGVSAIIAVVILSLVAWKQTGYWNNSISLWSHAINVTKSNPVAHYNLGAAFKTNNETNQAIHHYRKALAINPIQAEVYMSLGLALDETGQTEEVLTCFQKAALLDPENDQTQYNIGTLLFKQGKYDEAIPYLEKAVRLDPENDQAQFNLANTLFQKNQHEAALIHAQKTIALNPEHEKAHQLAGTIYLKQKQIGKALTSFKKALLHGPENEDIRQLLEQLTAKLVNMEQQLAAKLEKDPDNPLLRKQIGKTYQMLDLNDKALEQFEWVIKRHPESIDALYDLAALYADMGRLETAADFMRQAVSLQPDNPTHAYNIACLYARQNKISAALEWLQKAIDKGYANIERISTDADLSSIRDTKFFKKITDRP